MLGRIIAGRPLLRFRLRHAVQRNASTSPTSSSSPSQSIAKDATNNSRVSWALFYPLGAPVRAYSRMQARSPYTTQLAASTTIFFLGDLAAQLVAYTPPLPPSSSSPDSDSERLEPPGSGGGGKDGSRSYMYAPERGLRAMVIGAVNAIPSYKWFLFLGRHFNYGSHWASLAVKILVNQTFFTPVFSAYFFGMHSLLSGAGAEETWRRLADTVPRSWSMSWRFWPVVMGLNFTFVAPQNRSVAAGGFAIGWQAYLSWLNSKAAAAAKLSDGAGA